MDYLLLSEAEVRRIRLTPKQVELRRAVRKIYSDEDPVKVATELLERKVVDHEDIVKLVSWVKSQPITKAQKNAFKYLSR